MTEELKKIVLENRALQSRLEECERRRREAAEGLEEAERRERERNEK